MFLPFDKSMIQHYASESGLKYCVGEDGDIRMGFGASDPIFEDDPGMVVAIGSHEGGIIQGCGIFRIEDMTHAELLERCNRWNREHRWPMLVIDELAEAEGGPMVRATMSYPAAMGTTEGIVAHVCSLMVASMRLSWDWFRQESIDKDQESIDKEQESIDKEFAHMMQTIDEPAAPVRGVGLWRSWLGLGRDEPAAPVRGVGLWRSWLGLGPETALS